VRSLQLSVLASLLLSSCGLVEQKKAKKSDDVIETQSTEPFKRPSDCRAHIKEALCVVAPNHEPGEMPDNTKPRPCLGGEEKYLTVFEELYDNHPPELQKMFCSLRKIHIEQQFFGTAYANIIWKDEAKRIPDGAIMGIRQSVLDEKLNLSRWTSWKEQLSFGGVKDSYTVKDDLPKIDASGKKGVNDFLFFVITHEFGHFFDFANGLNKLINCQDVKGSDEKVCEFTTDSWAAMSWDKTKAIKPEVDFEHRTELCFYWCNEDIIEKDQIEATYSGLDGSPFISTYSTTNHGDDFAETIAYYMFDQYVNGAYTLVTPEQTKYSVIDKIRGSLMSEKVEFVKNVLARKDLKYP
jgi:hypothetical protein